MCVKSSMSTVIKGKGTDKSIVLTRKECRYILVPFYFSINFSATSDKNESITQV